MFPWQEGALVLGQGSGDGFSETQSWRKLGSETSLSVEGGGDGNGILQIRHPPTPYSQPSYLGSLS